jgi:hypothetical protein
MPEIGYERLDPVVTYITECQFPVFQAVTDKTPIMSLLCQFAQQLSLCKRCHRDVDIGR